MRTILFNGHDMKFLGPMIQHFNNRLDYHVLLDHHPGHVITDTEKSAELLEEADLIFCEWCLGNAEWYSHNKKEGQKLLIRLQHQELDLHYLNSIYWENVDHIIFCGQNNMRIFLERFPNLTEKARLIYIALDCNTLNQPKLYGAEFNLGIVGISPLRKGFHRAIELLNRLKKLDHRFTLFVKGKLPWEYDWLWRRPEERRYYQELFDEIGRSPYRDSIVFDRFGEDMPTWFSKIGFLLSTSDHEGTHQSVAESMASGTIPIIRNWQGADLVYLPRYVFETLDQAEELLVRWKSPENYRAETERAREYAFENFDQSNILPIYERLFEELLQSRPKAQASMVASVRASGVEKALDNQHGQKLRVMHVSYIKPRTHDGYVTRVIEEARVLSQAGVQIILACYLHRDFFSQPDQIAEHLAFLQNYTGAHVHLLPVDDFFDVTTVLKGGQKIADPLVRLAEHYGVQIIHGQSIYPTIYALEANQRIGAKLVFDMHGVAVEEAEMVGESQRRIEAVSKGEKEILKAADLTVFVSERMKEHYRDRFDLPFDNSIIIPTCVQSEKFSMPPELRAKKRQELGLDDRFVLLYLGTMNEWQWPEAMFSLFNQIVKRRSEVLFYLLLPQSGHEKAREFISQYDLPESSYIMREAPHDEVGSLIGLADAGLLLRKDHPVNRVSSPTKFGEYMAAGVPVIATKNIGDFSQIIEEDNLGLVLPLDSEKIPPPSLESILRFMDDVCANRAAWSERCSQYARTRLDWEVYGGRLQAAYSRLLEPGQGAA